jgi:hypothetical protein
LLLFRPLRLSLFAALWGIGRRTLLRPSLSRPLLLPLLLVPLLLLSAGRRWRALALALFLSSRITLTLTLFDRLAILFQNRPLDCARAFDTFRNRSLANNLANWLGRKRSPGRSCNDVHLWAFVNDDATA